MTTIVLRSPLAGWCLPLEEVPDAVFAQKMAGDGVAIEPTEGVVYAPCDGEVVFPKEAKHALTLRTASGQDVLIHVGIDTVQLDGQGFTVHVEKGDEVTAGQLVVTYDVPAVETLGRNPVVPVVALEKDADSISLADAVASGAELSAQDTIFTVDG